MTEDQLRLALERTIRSAEEKSVAPGICSELAPGPVCRLDLETYRLLVTQATWGKYSEYFSEAVRTIGRLVDREKIRVAARVIQATRSGGKVQSTRTRIGVLELKWVEDRGKELDLKPRAVLESVLYLYTRAMKEIL
jgi:hypothetical protein